MQNSEAVREDNSQSSPPTTALKDSSNKNSKLGLILSIASQKGGVGKSTVTVLLANIFHFHLGLKICIVDADYPQSSIGKKRQKELSLLDKSPKRKKYFESLSQSRPPYPIIVTDLKNCARKIDELQKQFDVILVDVPGTINQEGLMTYISKVTYFLIPVLQDDFSIQSAIEYYALLQNMLVKNSRFDNAYQDAFLFFNRIPFKNKLSSILPNLQDKVPILEKRISNYAIYERAFRSTILPIPEVEKLKASLEIISFGKLVWEKISKQNIATEKINRPSQILEV